MSIITISRGSYSHGKEVAEKVAQELGYESVSRDALLEASRDFYIPQIKLVHAMDDAPSFFERFTYGKEKYIAYIQAAILKRLQNDNAVYHGLAGHFFLRDISHVLKVRIIANMKARVRIVMEREGVSRRRALSMVRRIDQARTKWSKHLYGIDSWDSRLYDLVINIERITIDDAVDMICRTARLDCFKTTPESQRAMDDLVRSAEAKLAEMDPNLALT